MSGITGTQVELLYSLPAPVTKNTYTTVAVISALGASAPVAAVRGGFFSANPNPVGRSLFFEAFGTIANAATAATFIPAIGINTVPGTVIASPNNIPFCTAVTPTASTTAQWHCAGYITAQVAGETGGMTWQVNGSWALATVASGGAPNASGFGAQFAGSVTGLLASTTYYIELLGTWSASSSSATTTVQQMFLWGLN